MEKNSIIFTAQKQEERYEEKKMPKICYVVVSLLRKGRLINKYTCYRRRNGNEYNHSGDDGKEDPPVPIPNTEVKLFYAESTCRELPGG